MRPTLLAFAALTAAFALAPAPADAQTYPWCANYSGRGGSNCGFSTFAQCRAAVSGVGGTCTQNPFYGYGSASRPGRRGYYRY